MIEALSRGDVYILCPNNDVTTEMDHRRIQWNVGDIVENRPALSRWHIDYAGEYQQFIDLRMDLSKREVCVCERADSQRLNKLACAS